MKKVFKHASQFLFSAWGFVSGLVFALVVMIGTRYWPFGNDPNSWAGLGQWVGGIGALAAAWAALRIARKEARRENERDAETRRVAAYYVQGSHGGVTAENRVNQTVRNEGSEPVVNVDVVALHVVGHPPVKVRQPRGRKDVLLPGNPWRLWVSPVENEYPSGLGAGTTLTEIEFEDLAGTRWRRIGERPPEKIS
ncbi:hypothetical protein ACIBCH_20665 [Amycolatopsis thailandensis]|uniref:hypothetical protein n=1 Tax=Amycolatopsis thailandensis TaxID=589330 RepID=UPI003787D868